MQNWFVKMEAAKAFIENKGQFLVQNKDIIKSSEVLYAFDNGQEMIYFLTSDVLCGRIPHSLLTCDI